MDENIFFRGNTWFSGGTWRGPVVAEGGGGCKEGMKGRGKMPDSG